MALSNYDRVGKALDKLREGLLPFVVRELKDHYGEPWFEEAARVLRNPRPEFMGTPESPAWDAAAILAILWEDWHSVFKKTLGHAERSLVSELRQVRNQWAHQKPFSGDDTDRALDSMARLLTAVSAGQADEVGKMKMELRRLIFDEQMRSERRRQAGTAIEGAASASLKPWREVVSPHRDVASGRYQQAEFAADLWQVHLGEGSDEYRNPVEFFRRTYLTESLVRLMTGAVQRLGGEGGDPVVQLQTNFGGGKTHAMMALYHLFSGADPHGLPGVDAILKEAGGNGKLPKVKRVVLVGNKISPGNPATKPDGTVVRTLWGELAWQLGGPEAFRKIRKDDERATSPGDRLRDLMNEHGPCLILIDEWVAYARQLHDNDDLPGGSFETHFTFAQALTEAAKLAKSCLLVISLPASDSSGSPHARADDVEVGGERGRAALDRLRNAVGRLDAAWRPASAEEGFEIVRRRLFEPLLEQAQFIARDTVARAFVDLYRSQREEFPPECSESDYEKRIKAAYPIHPEVFDRLYDDWSTLLKFQRTRGVLRLMAAVIHSLWERDDRNPLIMPANISIGDTRVQHELTRYLSDNWVPVIEKDVDGPNALPLRLDGEVSNLGKYAASRRVARTIYLGSAPKVEAAKRGIEDRRIKLGCAMPGEATAVFGDALRRLAAAATYLYQDGPRYWYSTQPTVTKLAEDRAEQLKRHPEQVAMEIEGRVRRDLRQSGDFPKVHPFPASGADVPEDWEARLVVLGIEHTFGKEPGSPAETAAKAIFESRGAGPRLYRNTLVFLAADGNRMQDLDEAARRFLAWKSILAQKEELNLDPHQVKQAETQLNSAESAVVARIPETYQWLLVPDQATPEAGIEWKPSRLTGQDSLAVRASKKLKSDEDLLASFAGTSLRQEMDRIPLWRGNHELVKQLAADFASYVYLPRLVSPRVLVGAIEDGLALPSWQRESFAFADNYDEESGRYLGLRGGLQANVSPESGTGMLVRPEIAAGQLKAEAEKAGKTTPSPQYPVDGKGEPDEVPTLKEGDGTFEKPEATRAPKRFFGSVSLDPARVGRDAGQIADEVIAHLAGLVGAKLKVTLEIEAEIPSGAPDHVVRTVTENSTTLKFTSHGFEKE